MISCKLGFHDWKYVKAPSKSKFLGEEIVTYSNEFRICRRCGKVEGHFATYEGAYWARLSQQETEILKKKIVDKGDYYLLNVDH